MRVAFVHQNLPGQFLHLAQALGADPANEVVFITRRGDRALPGVRTVAYQPHRAPSDQAHHYLRGIEDAVLHGQGVVRAFETLSREGFTPDVVIGHPAWGELLFVKDVFPSVPLICYCEFYSPAQGVPVEGQPWPQPLDLRLLRRIENTPQLISLEAADLGWAPTHWQRASFPAAFHDKIEVVFDGVDLEAVRPDPDARLVLPSGRTLTRAQPVVTYAARGLEPHRGFPQFMRALPELLALRPDVQVVVAGADRCFYGPPPKDGGTWRAALIAETGLHSDRVHFVDWLAREDYLSLFQVSAAHVYLTVPFTLSWSFFDAMAAGCLVVGSETPPVQEVLKRGVNGLLVPLGDASALAQSLADALDRPDAPALRAAARRTMEDGYGAEDCVARQMQMIRQVMG